MTEKRSIDPHSIESAWVDDNGDLKLNIRASLEYIARSDVDNLHSTRRFDPTSRDLLRLAARMYDRRRERNKFLGAEIFGEPAWDMLLALYCFDREERQLLTVTSLSLAAEVKPTTGLRWQRTLLSLGLMERDRAPKDNRCVYVRLTEKGRKLLEEYLRRVFRNEFRHSAEQSIFRFSDSASEAK